ncbi:hypothetical protein CEQ90_18545 [Lewinellaceae bacterium SD302]|nr:hypothetical protein CEQ90_18545 [Lewinellaceae bacterium SD302]
MTIQDLLSMSPDAKTSEGARRLYFSRRWRLLGGDGKWLWGEFEVNSPKPLRAAVDLLNANFFCNCRSRYRPCTHALSLVMILNNQPERITVSSPTEWLFEYQQSLLPRHLREEVGPEGATDSAEMKSGGAAAETASSDSALDRAAAVPDKKTAARLQLMSSGIDELELRLLDIASRGLADTNSLGNDFWEDTANRLTDAKLGGLGNRLRSLIRSGEPDLEQQSSIIGDLYLAIRAWKKRDEIPENNYSELLQYAGVNLKKEVIRAQPGREDHWLVMGSAEGSEDRLRYRRVWLRGEQRKRYALLLEYAFGEQPFERSWPLASSWQGTVHYFPGSYPQRAVFPNPMRGGKSYDGLRGYPDFAAMLHDYRRALALQPWLPSYPVYLAEVRPMTKDGVFTLMDNYDHPLPLPADYQNFYTLLAAGGGTPLSLFAEFDGTHLRPLSLFTGAGLLAV